MVRYWYCEDGGSSYLQAEKEFIYIRQQQQCSLLHMKPSVQWKPLSRSYSPSISVHNTNISTQIPPLYKVIVISCCVSLIPLASFLFCFVFLKEFSFSDETYLFVYKEIISCFSSNVVLPVRTNETTLTWIICHDTQMAPELFWSDPFGLLQSCDLGPGKQLLLS